jgi:hypothetical protein
MARPKPTFQIVSVLRTVPRTFIASVILTSRTDVVTTTPMEFVRREDEDGPTFKARIRAEIEAATRHFDALHPEDPNDDPAVNFPPDEVEVDV